MEIEGFENIELKYPHTSPSYQPVEEIVQKEKCTECDAEKICWYKKLEIMCCNMRGR
jgi:hypothetical protein